MDVHKPKAAHSVREFLIEIGTIICGILIALGLEQGIEALHWKHKIEAAEHSMRVELAGDNGPQAYARAAITGCMDEKLNGIIQAVEAGKSGAEVIRLADAYEPPLRTWDRQGLDAAIASDITSHIGSERLGLWTGIYDLTTMLTAQTARESQGLDLMTGGAGLHGQLSPDQGDRIIRAAKSLRRANYEIAGVSLLMLKRLPAVGAALSIETQDSILRDARSRFGTCVIKPDAARQSHSLSEYVTNRELANPEAAEHVY
jgi:hypothetical protein